MLTRFYGLLASLGSIPPWLTLPGRLSMPSTAASDAGTIMAIEYAS